jgi:negative regulator of sigma E activity
VKPLALLACCGTMLGTLTLASANQTEPADALVYDAMAAPASVSYAGVVQTVRIGNDGSEASVYRVEHRAPNQTLRKYTSPQAVAGDYVVTRGIQTYSVDVIRHRVVQARNDAVNDQIAIDNNYLLLRENYRAVRRSEESVDGRDAVAVALVNNYTHRTTVIVRIDKVTKVVLDKQQYGSDGSLVSETRFEEISYDTAVPASDFALPKSYPVVTGTNFSAPSDDLHAAAASAGFAAREPKFLPEGFSPVQGRIDVLHGVRTLHVLYSDGLRTISLFENNGDAAANMARLHPQSTTIGGRDASYAQTGAMTLLAWRDGSLHYALVGDLRLDELQRIASSI